MTPKTIERKDFKRRTVIRLPTRSRIAVIAKYIAFAPRLCIDFKERTVEERHELRISQYFL
jgi:hypothetical protein